MRTPLCSLALTPESLSRARDVVRTVGDVLGLAPLQRARWLVAVSNAGREMVQAAGGGTLELLLDDHSPSCGGPALVARLLPTAAGGAKDPWEAQAPALARLRSRVDHLALAAEGGSTAVLTLESSVPEAGGAALEGTLRQRIDALLQEPVPEGVEALAQHDEDLAALLDGFQAELAAERSAHADALNTLAHDIRSPLLTLNLSLEMLRIKAHTPEELGERREVMKRQTEQLKALAAGLRQVAVSLAPPAPGGGELPPL